MKGRLYGGPFYSLTLTGVAVSAAQDIFELVAAATTRVHIHEIVIGQYSDAGDTEDELLGILLMRGHSTTGSGGAAVTPVKWNPYLRAAAATAARNNTTVASGGSPVTPVADAFNVRAGWYWRAPAENAALVLEPSARFVARITAPADALTMNATLVFSEEAKSPVA